jgi:citrate lyase subunit beta / citryl-CoA lyase
VRRAWLYVPGDEERKLERALQAPAAVAIADLEDAVPECRRDLARELVRKWLATEAGRAPARWVRVAAGQRGVGDLVAVWSRGCDGVVVAKAESADQLREVASTLDGLEAGADQLRRPTRVAALVETAAGLLAAAEMAAAPRVACLHLGEVDLAADLSVDPEDDDALLWARSTVVAVSAAARLPAPVGPVFQRLHETERLRESSSRLRRLGFGTRAAIHPGQLTTIDEAFSPAAEELAWARGALDAAAPASGGVTVDGAGRMVDEAVLRRARSLLAKEAE